MLDNEIETDKIVPSNEDNLNTDDTVVVENESTEPSLDELFKEIEAEILASQTEPTKEPEPEKDPFYSADPQANVKQLEELSAQVEAYAKEKETFKSEVDRLSEEVKKYEASLKEANDTVQSVNDLWKEAMEHPVLGTLLTKFVNNEEINIAASVLDSLKQES